VADSPVLKIPIDSKEWDDFVDSFMQYQKLLDTQGDKWASTNAGIKQTGAVFDRIGSSFDELVKSSLDPKFSDKSTGVFARFEKGSKQTATAWHGIERDLEKSSKSFEKMDRGITKWSGLVKGLGGLAGLGVGAATGIYGAVYGAAGDVANQYKSSRQLGLELGKEKEFGIAGQAFGFSRDQLDEAANAKADPTQQMGFRNAGVTDFTQDAAELAWQKALGEGRMFGEWEKTSPQFAVAQAKAFFPDENPDQLRLYADAYGRGDLQNAHDKYEQNWKGVGYDLQQAQAATDFKQDQSQKWAQVETAWNKDILLLAPHLDKWSDAAVGLTTKFLDASANTINDLANAADNPKPPGTAVDGYIPGDWSPANIGKRITAGTEMEGQWAWATFPGLTDPFNKAAAAQGPFTLDPDKKVHMAALEKAAGLPAGMLQAIENIESSGGTTNVNPTNPNVLGAFQFDAATARHYGVNRHDEFSGEVGATKKLADLYKKYHDWNAAVAAYDGFGGLDKDIAKYHDKWSQHISEFQKSGETEMYLRKVAWQGVDTDAGPAAGTANDKAHVQNQMQQQNNDFTERLREALQPVRDMFGEGGGARFASPQTNPQQNNINVTVTAPPGTNVQVSGAQLAQ